MRKLYVSGVLAGLLFAMFFGYGARPTAHTPQVMRVVAEATFTPSSTCGGAVGGFC